ncbi:MAG: aminotransferase class V-fold PLP-dependent enzyme [Gaiellaceae bacterium]
MTFEEARALFPALEHVAYLNAGSMGPLATPTAETMQEGVRRQLVEGRGGLPFFERMVELRQEVRARLAELLSVPPENVTLATSTTEACNIVLSGLELGPGDEIVTSDTEHFGLLGALHASGASVRVVPEGGIANAVTDRTRLVAISHVSWVTGNSLDPARVKEETGLPILVDGAQSLGAIPVDAAPFDFYTVSCQKWLCGPDATGGLYVRDPDALRIAWPSYFSQETHAPDGSFEPWPGAARFDPAWIPPASLAGLLAALDVAPDWRYERVAEVASACREQLARRFEVVTKPGQAGLVSFRPDEDAEVVSTRLYDAGVVVRFIPGRDLVRVSCGWWTSDDDLERLFEAL